MKTAILTDTNSGILEKDVSAYGDVHVIAMPVLIEEETYFEGRNIEPGVLYENQKKDITCRTSQPSPGDLTDTWKELLDGGYEEIVYIPMSSGLSGTCQTARMLAEDYEGKVQVVDNHRISVTMKQSVMDAMALRDRGMNAAKIREELERTAYESSIYITVDYMKELQKGGRMGKGTAALATLLNIKPVLTIQGEKLDSFAKARGMKKAKHIMLDALEKDRNERFGSYTDEQLIIGTAGTFETKAEEEEWLAATQEHFPNIEVFYDNLPCSIACHLGPGAAGIGISVRL